ncbi:TRPM8 channel-associated factor 2-like [Lissotriton helveticus]
MCASEYDKMKKKPPLQPSSVRVFTWGAQHPVTNMGKFTDTMTHNGKTVVEEIHVLRGDIPAPCLLSNVTAKIMGLLKMMYHMSEKESILQEYPKLTDGLGKLEGKQITLHINEAVRPVAQHHRRVPIHLQPQVEEEIKALLAQDIIEPAEGPTPWVSPIVAVPKKDTTQIRICVDMRIPNTAIERERHPGPHLDDMISCLTGMRKFSKLDLCKGYHQLELDEQSRYITTFSTHLGLFRYKRLSFGISSAAEIFQETIRQIIRPITNSLNYSDDILVFGKSDGEHDTALRAVCSRLVEVGLTVQIGCHTDNLSGKEDDLSKRQQLFRPPTVTKVYQVKSEKMTISTLWGGLIYILVPGRCQLGLLSITVTGAVRAPFYKHGETTDSDWLETVRHYPAPWAEFATENITLTVPAECALAVEKPSSLMSLWDRMMAAVAELAAIPFPFWRPERIVADVQISGGWMHAGYPIMAHTDSAKELTNFDLISGGIWGPIHELGHNQQCWGWNISPNTTEATCNLWSVYVSEKVLGIPRSRAHGDLHPECREQHIKNYLEKGAKLEDWTLWAALETYLQLQEAFGWAPFIQLFSDYQKMTDIKDENSFKMNLWAEKFSNQVKKNLAPFFKMWGWPIKGSVSAKLSSLPEWEENPMKKFVGSH